MSRIIKSNQVKLDKKRLISVEREEILGMPRESIEHIRTGEQEEPQPEQQEVMDEYYHIMKEKTALENDMVTQREVLKREIEQTKGECSVLIEKAKQEAEGLKQSERQKAYKEGFDQGYGESLQKYEQAIQEALDVKNQVMEWRKTQIESLEPQILELVIKSIEKIIDVKLSEDDSLILNILKDGLEKFAFTERLVLRVNPQDYPIVLEYKNRILALVDHIDEMEIKIDNSLAEREFIIDTTSGSINPSVSTQIQILKEQLYKTLQSE